MQLRKYVVFIMLVLLGTGELAYTQIQSMPEYLELDNNWDPDELAKLSIEALNRQDYPEAIKLATQALDIYVRNGNRKKEGELLENLGIIYGEFSDYQRSIEYLIEAVKIAEEQDDDKALNSRYFNIGTTYIEVGDFRKGISFLLKSLEYFVLEPEKNTAYLIAGYTNLGVAYAGINMPDSAMIQYETALDYANSSVKRHSVGGTLLNIAELYNLQGDPETALVYLDQSIEEFNSLIDVKGVWHAQYEIAHSYLLLNRIDEAITLLKEALEHFYKTNDLTYVEKTLNLISDAYVKQNDFESSYYYIQELLVIEDSISQAEILSEMSKIELQYEINKIHEATDAKFEYLEQQKRISTLRWYIATIILLVVLIIVFLLYSRKKIQKQLIEARLEKSKEERKNLRVELDYKNKELENFALHIVQKTEFLKDIKDELKKIKSDSSPKNKERISELNFKLNSSLRISNEIESFQNRVDDFYSKFFIILDEKWPDLTEKEKKLCALLRLNLASKEIATLNSVSVGAVTMARYRLRKKFGMDNEQSFADFFNTLED